jgi:hypothetical protein
LDLLKAEIQQIQVLSMRDKVAAESRFGSLVDSIPVDAALWGESAARQRDQISAARAQLVDRIDELVVKESVLTQHIVERAEA